MMTSRPSRPASRSGIAGERVQPVRVDHERHRRAIDELPDELARARRLAEARADRDDVARHLEDAIDAVGVEAVRRSRASASVMYSGPIAATIGLAAGRRRDGDEAGARPQRADRRQVRRAGLAARAGDDQHAAVVALVAVGRAAA